VALGRRTPEPFYERTFRKTRRWENERAGRILGLRKVGRAGFMEMLWLYRTPVFRGENRVGFPLSDLERGG